jgi:protein-S-isoprenylcysteine O-methyltransferase Ste14
MEVTGKPTVNPVLFVGGKIAGYFTWIILTLALTGASELRQNFEELFDYASYLALSSGAVFILFSSFTLGRSISIGLPTQDTVLQTRGIYRLSRNPMYVGVHLVTLAAMLITLKWWVILPGLISFYTYHQIVLGEEKFLEGRFGSDYLSYKQKIRRYI